MCDRVMNDMNDMKDATIVRLFSRQRLSATVIATKDIHIVGGTPVQTPSHTPSHTPAHTPSPSPPGSRSRANSYDLECYHQLAKEFEASGGVYMSERMSEKNV